MSFDYAEIATIADEAIAEYGAALTLTRTTPGAYDPNTGTTGTPTTATYTAKALRENYALKDIDGTLVKRGDVRLIVSPKQIGGADMVQPLTTDSVVFDSTTYQVIAVDSWDFNGTAVGFVVQARA